MQPKKSSTFGDVKAVVLCAYLRMAFAAGLGLLVVCSCRAVSDPAALPSEEDGSGLNSSQRQLESNSVALENQRVLDSDSALADDTQRGAIPESVTGIAPTPALDEDVVRLELLSLENDAAVDFQGLSREVASWSEELAFRIRESSLNDAAETMRKMLGSDLHAFVARIGDEERALDLIVSASDVGALDSLLESDTSAGTEDDRLAMGFVLKSIVGPVVLQRKFGLDDDEVLRLSGIRDGDLGPHPELAKRPTASMLAQHAADQLSEGINRKNALAVAALCAPGQAASVIESMLPLIERVHAGKIAHSIRRADWEACTIRWQWWFRGATEPRQSTLLLVYVRDKQDRWSCTYRGFVDKGEGVYQTLVSRYPGIEGLTWYD